MYELLVFSCIFVGDDLCERQISGGAHSISRLSKYPEFYAAPIHVHRCSARVDSMFWKTMRQGGFHHCDFVP